MKAMHVDVAQSFGVCKGLQDIYLHEHLTEHLWDDFKYYNGMTYAVRSGEKIPAVVDALEEYQVRSMYVKMCGVQYLP